MSGSYQDLRVWQQAMALAAEGYGITERFPKHEMYGLTSQIRRAVISVPSNIAEGKGHRSDKEFLHYLYHARGSLFELETQILLAYRLKYVEENEVGEIQASIATVARSLTGLVNSLSHLDPG